MSNRTLVAALAVVLVAAAVWYLVVVRGFGRSEPVPQPAVVTTEQPQPSPIQPAPADDTGGGASPAPELDPQRELQVAALGFVERYGTYSTDAEFANIRRLTPFVTSSYANELAAAMTRGSAGAGGFYSVTTRALSAKVNSTSETSAVLDVAAQRQEVFSRGGEVRLSYETMTVTLERDGEQWLVAGARWQK